ncbi:MAG: RluA family pseudouridine synthase [Spirochaetes bacterium]|nr:RluA family pseudouridine synthase [Spirochaetota bacterium]
MDFWREFSAGEDDGERRLDRIARRFLVGIPLSVIHRAIRKGQVRVNGNRVGPEYRIAPGDKLQISHRVDGETGRQVEAECTATNITDPEILFETHDLVYINKPIGVLVHDGKDSLDARVRKYLAPSLPPSLSFTPGPLHRLDRNTSGVVTFSKTLKGARLFSKALREGSMTKMYLAVLTGELKEHETWTDALLRDEKTRKSSVAVAGRQVGNEPNAAKHAVASVAPLAFRGGRTLAALRLGTGRTHQIRAQAAFRGHPLAGDVKYGGVSADLPYYLHAWYLKTSPDAIPGLPDIVVAPLPPYFRKMVGDFFLFEEKEVYLHVMHSFP